MTGTSEALSCYVLTRDSERRLADVIRPIRESIDDLLIVDSGSVDRTPQIATMLDARFVVRDFDNFRDQRRFALRTCRHRWVLSLDSDEIPDDEFAASLADLKAHRFRVGSRRPDAFRIRRRWFALGREVHACYPACSPDYPPRLFRKDRMTYRDDDRIVHERPLGNGNLEMGTVAGWVNHYPFDSIQELHEKLELYTALAAQELRRRGRKGSRAAILMRPLAAWVRWYVLKGGWKDGRAGWILSRYAYEYTHKKYVKLLRLS